MLTFEQFIQNILEDFKKEFIEVNLEEKLIHIGGGVTYVELPVESMYKEYQVIGYDNTRKMYIKIANKILNQYKFTINYNNVYPMLKNKNFGKVENDLGLYREHIFADIDLFYVTDEGQVFRFIQEKDDVDFDMIKKSAWENLNKMRNPLVKLDNVLEIYTLKFTTDYNSTLYNDTRN